MKTFVLDDFAIGSVLLFVSLLILFVKSRIINLLIRNDERFLKNPKPAVTALNIIGVCVLCLIPYLMISQRDGYRYALATGGVALVFLLGPRYYLKYPQLFMWRRSKSSVDWSNFVLVVVSVLVGGAGLVALANIFTHK